MRHENYKIMIGKNATNRTAAVTPANLADGEIAAFKPDMTALLAGETVSDAEYIYIAQGTATLGQPRFSAKIQGANVKKWSGQDYSVAVEQRAHVGNVGAAALAINVQPSIEYVMSIIFTFDKVEGSERQLVRRFHHTTAAAGATQQTIADAFTALIDADAKAKTLVDATTVNNGANYGVRIESRAQTYNVIDGYEQVTFKVVLEGGFEFNGTTPVSYTIDPTYGIGTYAHVSDLERAALGYDGVNNLMKFPVPSYPVYAVSTGTYDMYAIVHDDVHASANLNKDIASPEMTLIAINVQGGAPGQQAALQNELNPWFNSCAGSFPAVVL